MFCWKETKYKTSLLGNCLLAYDTNSVSVCIWHQLSNHQNCNKWTFFVLHQLMIEDYEWPLLSSVIILVISVHNLAKWFDQNLIPNHDSTALALLSIISWAPLSSKMIPPYYVLRRNIICSLSTYIDFPQTPNMILAMFFPFEYYATTNHQNNTWSLAINTLKHLFLAVQYWILFLFNFGAWYFWFCQNYYYYQFVIPLSNPNNSHCWCCYSFTLETWLLIVQR